MHTAGHNAPSLDKPRDYEGFLFALFPDVRPPHARHNTGAHNPDKPASERLWEYSGKCLTNPHACKYT